MQQILQFIANYYIFIFIVGIGLFNFSVRVAQKMREQRVKREAHLERQRQQQEFMRTGKNPAAANPQAPVVDEKAQRRERIEQLRQERMEQLRALREKRASIGAPAAQSTRTPVPVKPAKPARQGAPSGQRQPMPAQSPRTNQPNQPKAPAKQPPRQPQLRPVQPTLTPAQRAQQDLLRSFTQQKQSQQGSSNTNDLRQGLPDKVISKAIVGDQIKPTGEPAARVAGQLEKTRRSSSKRANLSDGQALSAKSMLRNRSSLRQAMVLREVLDTPVGLRDQDVASGSLFS